MSFLPFFDLPVIFKEISLFHRFTFPSWLFYFLWVVTSSNTRGFSDWFTFMGIHFFLVKRICCTSKAQMCLNREEKL